MSVHGEPRGSDAALPVCEFAMPGPLRDRLVAAVLRGAKTATSSLLEEYGKEPMPGVGDRFRVVDSDGVAVGVIEVTSVAVVPMALVDDAFAVDEGEGFASAEDWRTAHEDFWRSDPYVAELGIELGDETLIVTERFRLVTDDPA